MEAIAMALHKLLYSFKNLPAVTEVAKALALKSPNKSQFFAAGRAFITCPINPSSSILAPFAESIL